MLRAAREYEARVSIRRLPLSWPNMFAWPDLAPRITARTCQHLGVLAVGLGAIAASFLGHAGGGPAGPLTFGSGADSLAASPWARVIKASDFTDNGVGLIHTSGPKVPRLARKYAPLVPVLADLIARPDTPLAAPVKARILGQLVAAQQRFAVITQASAGGTDSLTTAGR